MQWKHWGVKGGAAVVLVAAMVGCAPVPPPAGMATTVPAASETGEVTEVDFITDDPFAYCAAVGTADEPGENYTGEEVPDVIAEGIRDAFGAEDVDLEVYRRGTVWRCVDGKVLACNVGANIPCLAKADESQEPTQPMIDFCQDNADSDFIPAVVTGRSTVYEWGCDDTTPVVVGQYTEVDSQGFLEFAWHELTPPQ